MEPHFRLTDGTVFISFAVFVSTFVSSLAFTFQILGKEAKREGEKTGGIVRKNAQENVQTQYTGSWVCIISTGFE